MGKSIEMQAKKKKQQQKMKRIEWELCSTFNSTQSVRQRKTDAQIQLIRSSGDNNQLFRQQYFISIWFRFSLLDQLIKRICDRWIKIQLRIYPLNVHIFIMNFRINWFFFSILIFYTYKKIWSKSTWYVIWVENLKKMQ